MMQFNRRTMLKSCGTAITGFGVLMGGAKAKSGALNPQIVKGTADKPIQENQIQRVRETIRKKLSSNTSSVSEIAVSGNPVPTDGKLVGYGIAVENGAPIEVIKCINDPVDKEQNKKSVSSQQRKALQKKIPEKAKSIGVEDRVKWAHRDLDKFRRKHEGGV
ncbi:hypothetical protein [Halorhabdus rudnickae]|uniref:hypothetical protein n=1 Tax=Halorhabdus rudnickae TaxID=1775544 RepID=UPI0010847045|nr:hypothetical protein [Halorhabdus rudnickae]